MRRLDYFCPYSPAIRNLSWENEFVHWIRMNRNRYIVKSLNCLFIYGGLRVLHGYVSRLLRLRLALVSSLASSSFRWLAPQLIEILRAGAGS